MSVQKVRLKHFYRKSDGRNRYRLLTHPVFCTLGKFSKFSKFAKFKCNLCSVNRKCVDDTFLGGAFFGIYTVRHQSVENKMNIRAKQKRFMITRQMYIRIMLKLQCIQQIHNMLTPSLIHIFK